MFVFCSAFLESCAIKNGQIYALRVMVDGAKVMPCHKRGVLYKQKVTC